jgi:hypothetical protein
MGGNGTFTTIKIPVDTAIIEITGPLILDKEIPPESDMVNYLQVGPNTYLGLSGGADDYINHSCEPNCKMFVIGNRAILFSLYVIPEGAELTFDYATTSTDNTSTWKMECKCGSFKCRKTISGYQTLDPQIQKVYLDKGAIPLFITNPGMFQKR